MKFTPKFFFILALCAQLITAPAWGQTVYQNVTTRGGQSIAGTLTVVSLVSTTKVQAAGTSEYGLNTAFLSQTGSSFIVLREGSANGYKVAIGDDGQGNTVFYNNHNNSSFVSGERSMVINYDGSLNVSYSTATPAGGSTAARLLFGTTAGFGIYYGSGVPTVSAAQGSIYLRSDGSSTSTRLYINTDGATTWTNVTTGS